MSHQDAPLPTTPLHERLVSHSLNTPPTGSSNDLKGKQYNFNTQGFKPIQPQVGSSEVAQPAPAPAPVIIPPSRKEVAQPAQPVQIALQPSPAPKFPQQQAQSNPVNPPPSKQEESGGFWSNFTTSLSSGLDKVNKKLSAAIDDLNNDIEVSTRQSSSSTTTTSQSRRGSSSSATGSTSGQNKQNKTIDTSRQAQNVITSRPIPSLYLRDLLQCTWCHKIVSNPVTIQCGHTICYHCIEEMYIIFNPGQSYVTLPPPDQPSSSSQANHENDHFNGKSGIECLSPASQEYEFVQAQNKPTRLMRVSIFDGDIECPSCNINVHLSQQPNISIMVNQTLALFHDYYESTPVPFEQQSQNVSNTSFATNTSHNIPTIEPNHLHVYSDAPTPTAATATTTTTTSSTATPPELPLNDNLGTPELPLMTPTDEIVLDLDSALADTPVRSKNDEYNDDDEDDDDGDDGDDDDLNEQGDLVSRLRNATLSSLFSLGNEIDKVFHGDEGNQKKKAAPPNSPEVDVQLDLQNQNGFSAADEDVAFLYNENNNTGGWD
jgi:hypothetical protein